MQENIAADSVAVQIICLQSNDNSLPPVSFAIGDTIEAADDTEVIGLHYPRS